MYANGCRGVYRWAAVNMCIFPRVHMRACGTTRLYMCRTAPDWCACAAVRLPLPTGMLFVRWLAARDRRLTARATAANVTAYIICVHKRSPRRTPTQHVNIVPLRTIGTATIPFRNYMFSGCCSQIARFQHDMFFCCYCYSYTPCVP